MGLPISGSIDRIISNFNLEIALCELVDNALGYFAQRRKRGQSERLPDSPPAHTSVNPRRGLPTLGEFSVQADLRRANHAKIILRRVSGPRSVGITAGGIACSCSTAGWWDA